MTANYMKYPCPFNSFSEWCSGKVQLWEPNAKHATIWYGNTSIVQSGKHL